MPFRSLRTLGGLIQIKFQLILICSGNLSFLNWLTMLPSIACLDDNFLKILFSKEENSSMWKLLKMQYFQGKPDSQINLNLLSKDCKKAKIFRKSVDMLLLTFIAYLSWPVISNLISSQQAMNTSFEPFRVVNIFSSVTKIRNEVIFKGTHSTNVNDKSKTKWHEYEFICKPGNVKRRPCVISPYHYRLDWLMWFAAFQSYEYNPWLLSLTAKFLLNDVSFTNQMIAKNPFETMNPPKYVKADLYVYEFSPTGQNESVWWIRKYVRNYLPPVSMNHLKEYIKDLDWDLDNYQHIL